MKKFPIYRQLDAKDCGPTCLRMIAQFYGKFYSQDFFREKSNITKGGVSLAGLAEAAELIGFESMGAIVGFSTLANEVTLPCIVYWNQRHFVVVYSIKANRSWLAKWRNKPTEKWTIRVADPAHGLIDYNKKDFLAGWSSPASDEEGVVMLLQPGPDFTRLSAEQKSGAPKRSFNSLWSYFSPYKRLIVQLFIGLGVGSLIQLIFPFLLQSIVDYGINYQNLNFIYLILIAQVVLFLSGTAVRFFRDWLLLHITTRVSIRLLSGFLAKLMRLSIGFFDSKNTGDILQRIHDNQRIENFLSNTSLNTLFSFFNLIIFGFVLAYYDGKVFWVFAIFSTTQVLWTWLFLKKRAEIDYRRFDQSAGNQSSTIQLIDGMQEIKLNNSDKRRRWEWEAIQVRLFRISVEGLNLAQFQSAGASFFNESKNIIITFITAIAVIDGQISLGIMMAIQYIIGQLNAPVNSFVTFIQSYQDAKLSLERLNDVYEKKDEESLHDNYLQALPEDQSIYLRQLSFRYGEQAAPLVLQGVDLTIPEGKVTAIVGASGSGKTTMIKLLLKFYPPTSGNIEIGNVGLEQLGPRFWREQCGVVMQDGFIFSDSIARNITESDSEGTVNVDRLNYASRVAHLTDFVDALPLGYHTQIGKSGLGLSGGQEQRILLARAIYKDPQYLFLDEATSALDANNEKGIMDELGGFFQNRTVIIVAHRLSTVRDADNIVVLDQGRIVEQGNHKTLAAQKGYYYELVKNQLELGN